MYMERAKFSSEGQTINSLKNTRNKKNWYNFKVSAHYTPLYSCSSVEHIDKE